MTTSPAIYSPAIYMGALSAIWTMNIVRRKENTNQLKHLTMNFKTHNETSVNAGGTSLQGYVSVSCHELLSKFGKPTDGDGYKTDAEWVLLFDDGKVATIYNHKDGKNYNGPRGLSVEQITHWHIGGRDKEVVDRVKTILGE